MRWKSLACITLFAATIATPGCRTGSDDAANPDSSSTDGEWAAEVLPWITQFGLDARRLGGIGAIPFLAEDVVVDVRTVSGFSELLEGIDGATAYFDAMSAGLQPAIARVSFSDTPHVDARGLVMPIEYDRSAVPGTSPPLPGYGALFADIGPTGIERYRVLPAIDWWLDLNRSGRTEPAEVAHAVTRSWVDVWSGGDAADLFAIYAPDAILEDEIEGIVVGGRQAIIDQWTIRPATTWSTVSRGDAPAVYLSFPPYGTFGPNASRLGVLAQLEGSAAGDCPGGIAVWWQLDLDGRIVHERRFRSVESARRCESPGDLRTGWWSGRSVPGPGAGSTSVEDLASVTQQISEGGITVDIHNGTPSRAALVTWGLARFDVVGLPLPDVRSVIFTAFTDYCAEVQGRTIRLPDEDPLTGQPASGGWKVVLCVDEDDLDVGDRESDPSVSARFVTLHELAHVWTEQNVDDRRRDHLLDWLAVPTWNDRRFEWDQRGTEWAADFIAWGLMDEPVPLFELDEPPLEMRFNGFQLLTGRRPLQPEP